MEHKYQVLVAFTWNSTSFKINYPPLTKQEAYERVQELTNASNVCLELPDIDEYIGIPTQKMRDVYFVAQPIPGKEKAQILSLVK